MDRRRWLLILLLVLITAYAVVLRCDAYTTKYGSLTSPAWARVLTTQGAAVGHSLRPYSYSWRPSSTPYAGGDPANYLRFAREMRSFYQAHVREPLFLALTRGYLWLMNGQDAALSCASATGSILAVLGTFMLASIFMSRWLALLPALALAIDYEIITWAVDGWRDDLFMATVVWTAWAFLRVRERPSLVNGLILGTLGAAACLTRITALSFLLPALVWLVWDGAKAEWRRRARSAAVALLALTVLVAPFLINCAIVTGDPFFAINYHTVYYRSGEGESVDRSVSTADYLGSRFARRPLRMADIGMNGLFVNPLVDKWDGLDHIIGWTQPVLLTTAAMLLLLWNPNGRLLLVVLFSSLLPYAFTWHIGDGRAFRFTMHTYPFYLVAVPYLLLCVGRLIATSIRERRVPRPRPSAIVFVAALCVLVPAAMWAYRFMPWLVVREAVQVGEDVNIESDERHSVFWTSGWSAPYWDGVTVRISTAERSRIALPLPARREYDVVLRADPVAPSMSQRLNVLFNGQWVTRVELGSDPLRVGSYRVRLREDLFREGDNQLLLIPEPLLAAADAGSRFERLPPDTRIGVRVWYVRILSPQTVRSTATGS